MDYLHFFIHKSGRNIHIWCNEQKWCLFWQICFFLEEISQWKLRILGVSYVITCFKTDLISWCSTVRTWYRQPVTQIITQTSCIPAQPLVPFNIIIIHLCYLSTLFKASYYLVQGSKKNPSGRPGQVDFLFRQVAFSPSLPDRQGPRQAARRLNFW